jgi:hypothetical protein
MVRWPFSRRWPGPAKITSMNEGSLMWTSSGAMRIIGPRERYEKGEGGRGEVATVLVVHFFDFPVVLTSTDQVVIHGVETCGG